MRAAIGMISALSLAVLAGCQGSMTFDRMDPIQQASLLEEYRADCREFGFRPGTTAFADCVQKSVIERDRGIQLQRAAFRASTGCGPGYGYRCGYYYY